LGVHRIAATGFGRVPGEYERARPGYPAEVVELLATTDALRPGGLVVDVAAGTGKLTRDLSPSGATVVAVEPLASMREALVGTPLVVAGTAEALPLRTGAADLVTVAQAFHWFDVAAALAEVGRVTRPGGWLALVWNERDESVPWVKAFGDVIERHAGGRPYTRTQDWGEVLAGAGYADIRHLRLDHPQVCTRAGVVERAASTSFVAALPEAPRAAALAEIATLVGAFAEPFPFPNVTDVHLARAPAG
jgi:SAM-dependent methyltransferase